MKSTVQVRRRRQDRSCIGPSVSYALRRPELSRLAPPVSGAPPPGAAGLEGGKAGVAAAHLRHAARPGAVVLAGGKVGSVTASSARLRCAAPRSAVDLAGGKTGPSRLLSSGSGTLKASRRLWLTRSL
ncbi:hypothetical protein VPH35_062864 [Triticum aestivum]